MNVDAQEFVKQKEHNLANKYARRTLRRVVHMNAISTQNQLDEIERAYTAFIEMPFEVKT